ncbi:MAG: flagellar export protein FliJ [Gammaproteobacteria bacterium]
MKRSNRMDTIIGLSKNQKDIAAKTFAQSQQLLEQSKAQLADMKRCRREYSDQLGTGPSHIRTASELKGIRIFIQQLDVAIQQLDQQVIERATTNAKHQDQWLKLHNKTRALGNIKERYANDEQKMMEQKEQFEIDELSQRK